MVPLEHCGDWANYKAVRRTCAVGKSELVIRLYFNREEVGSRELNQYKRHLGIWASSYLPVLRYGCVWMANVVLSVSEWATCAEGDPLRAGIFEFEGMNLNSETILYCEDLFWCCFLLEDRPAACRSSASLCVVKASWPCLWLADLCLVTDPLPCLTASGKACWGAVLPKQVWALGLCEGFYKQLADSALKTTAWVKACC